MGIKSFLRGSLPSFYSAEVLLPLINLGKGLPQYGQGEGHLLSSIFGGLSLRRAVAPVHRSGWRKADVFPWRSAPSTLFLGGWSTTTVQLYAGTAGAGRPLVGVAWTVCHLLTLSSRSTPEHTELAQIWSFPSRGTPREEVFGSLAVLSSFSS
jgi:hypothetical protein